MGASKQYPCFSKLLEYNHLLVTSGLAAQRRFSHKRNTDSVGNRIALSSTSGTGSLFPTRPKWAVGKHLDVLKKSQCHPDVSQSLSP